ncbi:amino acid ABC transporter permease [Ancylobacter sp. Lp-2]|uniref:amino acid ABC transporter permease n=1 Tax=Ancylobacter sp. Lp-2 TaxID=2881339 RepID=UPI001E620F30|nr:amino acid ABC transporter permease [Ancylobacter sp. Lp-2]MCB4767895.1 amino acid ABC transporter permease [Ancylobacter sp. Lp-2]
MTEKIAVAGTSTIESSPLVDAPLNGAITSNAAANREASAVAKRRATATARTRRWLRTNLFSSPLMGTLSVLTLLLLGFALPPLFRWAFLDAVFDGSNRSVCGAGACWAFIADRLEQFAYGRYTPAERWRVDIALALLAGFAALSLWSRNPHRALSVLLLVTLCPAIATVLLIGGVFGLPFVPTDQWGGLSLNIILTFATVVLALPLGVVLAMGRRSQLSVIRWSCTAFIEVLRGVPLLTVLFMAMVMLPMFLPEGVTFDRLVRAIIGLSLFVAAYFAEIIRAGLQGIPKGQYEAAAAIGLGFWGAHRLIVLPQAFRLVVPGIVNTVIDLFKDTTLVSIIGLFDLLGVVGQSIKDPNWLGLGREGYAFAALVFFICCYAMSLLSLRIERRIRSASH